MPRAIQGHTRSLIDSGRVKMSLQQIAVANLQSPFPIDP